MEKWNVIPCKSVGNLTFAQDRAAVRDAIGMEYRELRKSKFSKNTMDAYNSFHVYYDKTNHLEAIEFFDEACILINGKKIFPGKIERVKKIIPDLMRDEFGYVSKEYAVGITVSAENSQIIESILVGRKDYY